MPILPSNVTVTSVAGPAISATAQVFNAVTDLDLQLGEGMLFITNNAQIYSFSLTPVTTITVTISASVATVVIS